ncbi:S41 family peptidase [Mucilaginibacter pedocola]|uniref:Tail specific protease domain-containing protein n=1 Tax=Mucilaginibacter pedocola TaxID=1792845 RepID=A0A1S9PDV3_9SPHI|nr:S41 family peptidase [Mucilaginibacter pedocola]OOQ59142.1 hypothetical protein BC343_29415 [Mucilaginibacter pedocola]
MKPVIRATTSVLVIIVLLCSACNKAVITTEKSSSIAVFDYLWNTLDTKYAMFTYKKVNWQAVYNKYRPQVSDATTQQDLFNICTNMLDELKDGHVSLSTNTSVYSYTGYYQNYGHNYNADVLRTRYLTALKSKGIISYQLTGGISYIHIPSFGSELKANDINAVLEEFKDVTKIMIDVRDNTGGGSVMVDLLASKFATQKILVKYDTYKRGTGHDDYFPEVAKYVEAGDSRFAGKRIAVLTNRRCFSSCNDFVLYMSELPGLTIIGDKTGGGGGTPFNIELPNGWVLSYSSSFATSPSGFNIEDGITPDILVTNSLADDVNRRDAIFEAAVNYLNK